MRQGVEFDSFKKQAGSNAFTLSPQKWIEATDAIGIVSKSGRYGGTFAHSDIAFEFVMAKHADASIPNTPEEWLDGFNTFSTYQVLTQLIELWGLNVKTDVEAKKFVRQTVKCPPLCLLRCVQLGLSMADLELLSIGLINDMYAESRNDDCKYAQLATQ